MYPAPPPMERPTTMRVSSALLFGVAALALVGAVIELLFVNTGLSVYRDTWTGETGSGFGSIFGATLDIFFAAGLSILAILNGHGRRNARVVTLVLGGLFFFCGGFATLADRPDGASRTTGDGTLGDILPTAYGITVAGLDVLITLGILGALVLLVLPPSNRFFINAQLIRDMPPPPVVVYLPQPVVPAPRGPEPPPHTGSIPAIDPWASQQDRHQQ
jgi:hypothetical protein